MMSDLDLVNKLKEMHNNAPHGDKAMMIILFGVRYASEIAQSGVRPNWIAERALGQKAYGGEISKGCKLSECVRPR